MRREWTANATSIYQSLFEEEARVYVGQCGGQREFKSFTPSRFFRVGVYTVLRPAPELCIDVPDFLGFRAVLYTLASNTPRPRMKVLAKSMTIHGMTIKTAMNGLLEVMAGMFWHHFNEELLQIEQGGDGFFTQPTSLKWMMARSGSPAFPPRRQPPPHSSSGLGSPGREDYFSSVH
jgi:hypothetical protein